MQKSEIKNQKKKIKKIDSYKKKKNQKKGEMQNSEV